MAQGPFGGPRPLLSQECVLVIRDYTALPSPTISGGASPDRTEEFRQAAQKHLPVASIETEPHDVAPGLFGDYLVAELESDRLPLDQYMAFVEGYARLLGTEDLRVVNVGIDARVAVESRFPRPFVETGVLVAPLIEIRLSDGYSTTELERLPAFSGLDIELGDHRSICPHLLIVAKRLNRHEGLDILQR